MQLLRCLAAFFVSRLLRHCIWMAVESTRAFVKEKPTRGSSLALLASCCATVLGHSVTDLWSDTTKLALAGVRGGLANIDTTKVNLPGDSTRDLFIP